MTTEKPTCPFCFREMVIGKGINDGQVWCDECAIGVGIGHIRAWRLADLTAAVMEMRKRDCYEAALSFVGPWSGDDFSADVDEFFTDYIESEKAEVKRGEEEKS